MCKSGRISQLGAITYREPVKFSTTEIEVQHQPELWACAECGSWFTQNIVSSGLALELYEGGSSNEKWVAEPFAQSKSTPLRKALDGWIRPSVKMLDVGCNTGELLDYGQSRGASTHGVEPSVASREVCLAKGHQMHSSLSTVTEEFDVVTAFDLIEHLHDPGGFLEQVRLRLRPGGHLILLTGDNQSVTAKRFGPAWWYLRAPEHIVFPSSHYFKSVEGFEFVSKRRVYASVGYEPGISGWIYGALKAVIRLGEGLPLIAPDHQLLILQRR